MLNSAKKIKGYTTGQLFGLLDSGRLIFDFCSCKKFIYFIPASICSWQTTNKNNTNNHIWRNILSDVKVCVVWSQKVQNFCFLQSEIWAPGKIIIFKGFMSLYWIFQKIKLIIIIIYIIISSSLLLLLSNPIILSLLFGKHAVVFSVFHTFVCKYLFTDTVSFLLTYCMETQNMTVCFLEHECMNIP